MRAASDFDVVLYGPTGVTGREVARYLSRRAPELGLSWAVAGRDRSRIEATLEQVDATPGAVLLADSSRPSTIAAMVQAAGCVANLVGPYGRHGEAVYAACAELGRNEVDPTGETAWVREMIDRYDDQATGTGAVIVPAAGYAALPFDLGALYAAHALHGRTGDPVVEVDVSVTITWPRLPRRVSEVLSAGTVATLLDDIRRGDREAATNPYALDTPGSPGRGRYDLRPRKHAATRRWVSPKVPTPFTDPPVVHRSAALLRDTGDTIYATTFRYHEGSDPVAMVPEGAAGPVAAALAILSAGTGLLQRSPDPVRRRVAGALGRFAPPATEPPPVDELDAWRYRLDIRATDARGAIQDAVVEARGHPGYRSTSTMLGEAALALADDTAPLPDGAGFLTPATALGLGFIERLGRAGMRFRLLD